MKITYTGKQFNLVRLLLLSEPTNNIHYQRYAAGFYFNIGVIYNGVAVFRETNEGILPIKKIQYMFDIYFSKKDYLFIMAKLK